ncbi:MAG: anti-sigma factor [Bacteroidetes bacterium]|nr:anti-sigma factor [Bacteroidota bacterium]
MNIEEYIASGILELYVLSALSEAEATEVKRVADLHPEVMEEIYRIEDAMISYAENQVAAPNSIGLQNVLNSISKKQEEATVIQLPSAIIERKSANYSWVIAAAIGLLIISNISTFYFFNKWKNVEGQLAEMEKKNSETATQFNLTKNKLDDVSHELAMYTNPSMKKIMLGEVSKGSGYTAMAMMNEKTNEVYLKVMSLPSAPGGMQYQLWAMVDGKPVDAGVVTSMDGIHKMKTIANAEAFAITLEPMGGSAAPTMPMYVMGKV